MSLRLPRLNFSRRRYDEAAAAACVLRFGNYDSHLGLGYKG